MENLYEILGIQKDATIQEIKAAYRKQAKTHHPDRTNRNGDPEIRAINYAYKVLSDPIARDAYDSGREEIITGRRAQAVGKIKGQIYGLLDEPNLDDLNIVETIKLRNNELIKGLHKLLIECRKEMMKFERNLHRIRKRTPGKNIFEQAIINKIERTKADIRECEAQVELCKEVAAVLGDYEMHENKLVYFPTPFIQ